MGLDRRHHRYSTVVGRTHFKAQTVSLALLTSSTSFFLLGEVNNIFNPKDSSYLYLLPSLMVNFLANYLELCNIVTFLFLTLKQ